MAVAAPDRLDGIAAMSGRDEAVNPVRPLVWFERAVLADLADEVAAQVTVLGPATDTDPHAGLAPARGVVAGSFRYDGAFMDRASQLRVIARTGIGVDTVDLAEATARSIAVCNAPDGPTISTAEHAVMLILAAAKSLKRSETALRAGEGELYARHAGMELDGKVLGLIGFGRIARRVAAIMQAFGMDVMVYDPYLGATDVPAGVTTAATRHEVLAAADVPSLHVPLTATTRHSFDNTAFAAMKPGAVFVNTARGGLVDHGALLAALDGGHLFAAGLDVTDPEPLPPDHPLLHRNDVIVTPHVASGTTAGKRRIFRTALEQVLLVLSGRRPPHLVNPEVWEHLEPILAQEAPR